MPRKPTITYGYNHLEPGAPGNPKPYRVCGARTRNPDAKGEYCTQAAGHRTNHPGVGRCWLHGGATLSGPNHAQWKGGRYEKVLTGRMREYLAATQGEGEEDPTDLRDEIGVLRMLLMLSLEEMTGSPGSITAELVGAGVISGPARDNPHYQKEEPPTKPMIPPDDGERSLFDGEGWTLPQGEAGRIADDDARQDNEKTKSLQGVSDNDNDVGVTTFADNEPRVYGAQPELLCSRCGELLSGVDNKGKILVDADKVERVKELVDSISGVAGKMVQMRNQTALTNAEIVWLASRMKEAMEMFVPREKHGAYVKWLRGRLPVALPEEVGDE